MSQSAELAGTAIAAFDEIAESYDEIFTHSVIGRAQRDCVWETLAETFRAGDRILELNCGTGEDALFLGRRGVAVEACDGSARMIEVCRRRKLVEAPDLPVRFEQWRTERVGEFPARLLFDGALSNFGGLNCVPDFRQVAANLSTLVRRGGRVVLCFSSRVCLWEVAWFCAQGEFAKAFRRAGGRTVAMMAERRIPIWYPTRRQIERAFTPYFELSFVKAVGLLVPPTYLESWARKQPGIIARLAAIDRAWATWPVLRGLGDHVLMRFERTSG
jgi:SAM-dependent methyltransferase